MTLFSYHKYNDFILIQEIYTQKYTACTKDEANRIADNNLQSDGISYANGLAQADRCDCVEPTKTWSADAMLSGDPCKGLPGSTSALRCSYEVFYNNQCGSSKSITVTVTGRNDNGQTVTAGSTSVSIPTGSGKKTGVIGFDLGVQCGSISVSGGGSGNC